MVPGSVPESRVCLSPRPQIAVRLLAHKIQSPQEWEAVQALTVCGFIAMVHFSEPRPFLMRPLGSQGFSWLTS